MSTVDIPIELIDLNAVNAEITKFDIKFIDDNIARELGVHVSFHSSIGNVDLILPFDNLQSFLILLGERHLSKIIGKNVVLWYNKSKHSFQYIGNIIVPYEIFMDIN